MYIFVIFELNLIRGMPQALSFSFSAYQYEKPMFNVSKCPRGENQLHRWISSDLGFNIFPDFLASSLRKSRYLNTIYLYIYF